MKRLLVRVAGLMVVFGALSVTTARAQSHFSVHVGVGVPIAPVVVAPRVAVAPAPYPYPAYHPPPPPVYSQPVVYYAPRTVHRTYRRVRQRQHCTCSPATSS